MQNWKKYRILEYIQINKGKMVLKIPITKSHIYSGVLNILNFSTQLTNTEIELIVAMLNNQLKVLTKRKRASLCTFLNKDKYTINNHIKRMKSKGVFIVNEDRWLELNPNLIKTIDKVVNDKEIVLQLDVS